jgi:hypothetical protein
MIVRRGALTNMPDDPQSVPGRKTIYVHRMCGAGNQLFQWAFSKALAIELDADLHFGSDASCIAHDDILFNFPGISKIKTPPPGTPVFAAAIKSTPEDFENAMRYIANNESGHVIISGNFQRYTHIDKHEAAIREALTIDPLPEYKDCIAVCVRRGDFPATGSYIDLSPQWFLSAVEYVKSRIGRPSKVVVFSDDPAWCRANLLWEAVSKDAWHDMRAIRSCAGVVFTNSTFHWWGAWLANVPTVCAAATNYQHPETFYDPRWVQMHNDGVVSIPVEPGGHVTSANYGADRGKFDVTNIINKLHAQGLRHLRACNEIAGDPAPNVVKRLELEFADGRKLRVPENGIADIGDLFHGHPARGTERRISLCIPHYSGPNYDRVGMLLQSFEHVINDPRISEVIVNDDRSEDQSHEQTAALLKGFPKVKLFRNEQNLGPYRNRRMAIERAASPWVIALDNDNAIGPDFLDKIFGQEWRQDSILAPDFAKPIFDFRRFDGLVVTKSNVASCVKETELFLAFINDGNYFVNRQRYLDAWDGTVDPGTSDSEYFNYCWLAAGNQIKVVAGLEYFHRVHPQSYYRQNQDRAGDYHRMVQDKIAALEAVSA